MARQRKPLSRKAAACATALATVLPAAAAGGPEPPPAVDVAAVGDIAMAASPSGPGSFFDRRLRRELASDVTLGNLEGTLTTRRARLPFTGRPGEIAVIRAGGSRDFGRNAVRVTPKGELLLPAWRTG